MKKLIALVLAGVMVFSLPVMAADSPSAKKVSKSSSSSSSTVVSTSAPAAISASSSVDGIAASVVAAAAESGLTVGEYLNNAIVSVPGLESATPIGQGGHVIINGAPSNQTFAVNKPSAAAVSSAKAQAAALGGSVMNVVDIKAAVSFTTARVNFYMPGVKAGQNIKVCYLVNGQWVELEVPEIREDHVVVDMTGLGTLAFINIP